MRLTPLHLAVGTVAIAAPALHVITDVVEWMQGGFTAWQLWLNYVAFAPMPWLLLGIFAVHERAPGALGLVGALMYGAAFTYFAFTTLYALADDLSDYHELWEALGNMYTLHGALMVAGGILFALSVLRAGWLPKAGIWVFLAGLVANLILGLIAVPEILQTLGSGVRNAGLILMGVDILGKRTGSIA